MPPTGVGRNGCAMAAHLILSWSAAGFSVCTRGTPRLQGRPGHEAALPGPGKPSRTPKVRDQACKASTATERKAKSGRRRCRHMSCWRRSTSPDPKALVGHAPAVAGAGCTPRPRSRTRRPAAASTCRPPPAVRRAQPSGAPPGRTRRRSSPGAHRLPPTDPAGRSTWMRAALAPSIKEKICRHLLACRGIISAK